MSLSLALGQVCVNYPPGFSQRGQPLHPLAILVGGSGRGKYMSGKSDIAWWVGFKKPPYKAIIESQVFLGNNKIRKKGQISYFKDLFLAWHD